jgi:hypothetical protein
MVVPDWLMSGAWPTTPRARATRQPDRAAEPQRAQTTAWPFRCQRQASSPDIELGPDRSDDWALTLDARLLHLPLGECFGLGCPLGNQLGADLALVARELHGRCGATLGGGLLDGRVNLHDSPIDVRNDSGRASMSGTRPATAAPPSTSKGSASGSRARNQEQPTRYDASDIVVEMLRDPGKAELELRFALGLGKPDADAPMFPETPDGGPISPGSFSAEWCDVADAIGLVGVPLQSLRHTHASQLSHEGVDVVTISKRLGSPASTLTYSARMTARPPRRSVRRWRTRRKPDMGPVATQLAPIR